MGQYLASGSINAVVFLEQSHPVVMPNTQTLLAVGTFNGMIEVFTAVHEEVRSQLTTESIVDTVPSTYIGFDFGDGTEPVKRMAYTPCLMLCSMPTVPTPCPIPMPHTHVLNQSPLSTVPCACHICPTPIDVGHGSSW